MRLYQEERALDGGGHRGDQTGGQVEGASREVAFGEDPPEGVVEDDGLGVGDVEDA